MWSILLAFAANAFFVQAYDYSTLQLCTTKYGSKSTSVKTSSYALTVPYTVTAKLTVTPTSTITPPPETTTSTTTSTTTTTVVTTPTSTFTDTTTETSTAITTTIVTTGTTVTSTTTTSVATSTVPTPAGFTPVASAPGYVAKKRSLEEAVDSVPAIRGRAAPKPPICPQLGNPGAFKQYPQSVICGALVIAKTTTTKTSTATNTASTTLPVVTSTITSTAVTTETTTSAAAPASTTTTTTVSVSTTTTATSTATTTSTQTVTAVQAGATVYAACAANNIVNHANGNQGIFQVYYAGGGNAPVTSEIALDNAVTCCEQCQKLSGCTGFAKYPGAARCFLFTQPPQCDAAGNLGQFFKTSSSFGPNDGYTIGNGQCGQIANGGSDG